MTRTLLITGYGKKLSVNNKLFLVSGRGMKRPVRVNPADIEDIVITGGASITTNAVRLAVRSGITIYVLTGPQPAVISSLFNIRTSSTRRMQYRAEDTGLAREIAVMLVASKIHGQARVIRDLYRYRADSEAVEAAKKIILRAEETSSVGGEGWKNALRLIEAEAARIYWGALSLSLPGELGFNGRDHDSCDPVNAAINYLYALLYSKAYRDLVIAGLDPYAGVLHTDRSGRESLVYDFVEPVKPLIDHHLAQALLSGWKPVMEECLLSEQSRLEAVKMFSDMLERRVKPVFLAHPMTLEEALLSMAYRLAGFYRKGIVEASFHLWWT